MANKIVELVKKLIAHEKSARAIGNIEEAEAFASKIQELTTNYKLNLSDEEFQTQTVQESMDWEVLQDPLRRNHQVPWRTLIAKGLALVNSCEVVYVGGANHVLMFAGRESDRKICATLYIYFTYLAEDLSSKAVDEDEQKLIFRAVRLARREGIKLPGAPRVRSFREWMRITRDSWRYGFAESIIARIIKKHHETIAAANSNTAITRVNKDALAAKEFIQQGPLEQTEIKQEKQNHIARGEGQQMGERVSLSTGRLDPEHRTSYLLKS